jgi:7-cyano-7-deazaguanine reductase
MKRKLNLKALGNKVTKFTKLDTFPKPKGVTQVTCRSDEVTAVCPVTGQPDWYVVLVYYRPNELCVESKSLKLYLQSFRQQGHFCENFSAIIAEKIFKTLKPFLTHVAVTQKPRGGIAIQARVTLDQFGDPMIREDKSPEYEYED